MVEAGEEIVCFVLKCLENCRYPKLLKVLRFNAKEVSLGMMWTAQLVPHQTQYTTSGRVIETKYKVISSTLDLY